MVERGKASYASLVRALRESGRAEREAAKQVQQKYEEAYQAGQQALSWGLKIVLDQLAGLTCGEIVNRLTKLQGDLTAIQQRHPGVCVAIVGLVSRRLKLRRQDIEVWLDLVLPTQHDALDAKLLDVVRELEPEVKSGLLPVSRIADVVNADRTPNEAFPHKLLINRLRALTFLFTKHHPPSLIWNRSLLFPSEVAVAAPFVPPLVESNTHENGSHTE